MPGPSRRLDDPSADPTLEDPRHGLQPAQPNLTVAAGPHPARRSGSCSSWRPTSRPRSTAATSSRRLQRQEHRGDLREDVDPDAGGVRGRRLRPGRARHVSRAQSGSQIGYKESMRDTARVLGRMYDGIEYRGFAQDVDGGLGKYAGVPVWNGLTDEFHPDADPGRRPHDDGALATSICARSRSATSATRATTWATRSWSAPRSWAWTCASALRRRSGRTRTSWTSARRSRRTPAPGSP